MKTFDRKKNIRLISLIMSFILSLALCVCLAPPAMALEDPNIDAASAILFDVGTGSVLYEKNAHERRAPASLTKVMTVMIALEACDSGVVTLDDEVTVHDGAYFDVDDDGSSVGLQTDEVLTLEQLLYCAMVASANEACNVIAEYISGDVASFVERMNAHASDIGCTDTHFANTHGMPNDDHYSTASDMLTIARLAMENDVFRRLVSTASITIPATNKHDARKLSNTNSLLHSDSYAYYEYATGVKTGSTNAAGYCLIAAAGKDGRQLMSVVMGAGSTVAEDGRTQLLSMTESRRLLEWGFNNFAELTLLSTMDLVAEIPVRLGRGVPSVVLRPAKDVTALLPIDSDLEKVELDITYSDESKELTAPVESETVLGSVTVSFQGVEYATVDLVANSAVQLDRPAFLSQEISKALSNKYVRIAITVIAALLILYVAFIVYYNIMRTKRKLAARKLADQRVAEYRASREATTSKSFEEIEAIHRQYDELSKK